jgi:hypothetical protein
MDAEIPMWQEPRIGKARMPKSSMLEDQRIGTDRSSPPPSPFAESAKNFLSRPACWPRRV